MMYVATVTKNRLVLSNHDDCDYVDFVIPETEELSSQQAFQTYWDTILDSLQTIVSRFGNVDYVFFVGTRIGSLWIPAQWFAVDHSNSDDIDVVTDLSTLPTIFNFGTPDIYWED